VDRTAQNSGSTQPKITFSEKSRFHEIAEESLTTLLHDAAELFRQLSYDQIDLNYQGSGSVHEKVSCLLDELRELTVRSGFSIEQLSQSVLTNQDHPTDTYIRRLGAKSAVLAFMSLIIAFFQTHKEVITRESLGVLFGYLHSPCAQLQLIFPQVLSAAKK
jgi:hypothetical protein